MAVAVASSQYALALKGTPKSKPVSRWPLCFSSLLLNTQGKLLRNWLVKLSPAVRGTDKAIRHSGASVLASHATAHFQPRWIKRGKGDRREKKPRR